MLVFSYFIVVMLTVLTSSTMGTVLLVRACHAGHLRRRAAMAGILVLALGLPLAVPLAAAAVFIQIIQVLPGAGALTVQQEAQFMIALGGSILASLLLCIFGAVNGIRRLPQAS